ncbi:hypothetical protein LCGC14_2834050 [marine sediment metagenome]|uniref:Uncharacterized protein n=1 Tax=marine sediment metagenome TaxID=412755 RepID=A0A0F8YDE2_9ZZZZ
MTRRSKAALERQVVRLIAGAERLQSRYDEAVIILLAEWPEGKRPEAVRRFLDRV